MTDDQLKKAEQQALNPDKPQHTTQPEPPHFKMAGDTLCFQCLSELTEDDHFTIGNSNYCMVCAAEIIGTRSN
mgnify:CR=1 FL=1|jgi:hypothetical protein